MLAAKINMFSVPAYGNSRYERERSPRPRRTLPRRGVDRGRALPVARVLLALAEGVRLHLAPQPN